MQRGAIGYEPTASLTVLVVPVLRRVEDTVTAQRELERVFHQSKLELYGSEMSAGRARPTFTTKSSRPDQLTTSAPVLDRYCFTLNFGHCHWRLTPLIQC